MSMFARAAVVLMCAVVVPAARITADDPQDCRWKYRSPPVSCSASQNTYCNHCQTTNPGESCTGGSERIYEGGTINVVDSTSVGTGQKIVNEITKTCHRQYSCTVHVKTVSDCSLSDSGVFNCLDEGPVTCFKCVRGPQIGIEQWVEATLADCDFGGL